MKTLKFEPKLVEKIMSGEKTTTWRLWDDKGLKEGDIVEFINKQTGKIFAKVKLTKVYEKSFKELNQKDWSGHEEFSSESEMYDTYSKYYSRLVTSGTLVKVIHFKTF